MFNPRANVLIEAGDKVAVIGEPEHFSRFEEMARGNRTNASGLSDKSLTALP